MKIAFSTGSALVLLSLSACSRKEAEPPAAPPPAAIHVDTVTVQAHPMPRTLPLTGSLVSHQKSDVAANASGVVIKTFVERGALVKEGQPLVQLDTRGAELSQAEARANLGNLQAQQELAQSQCERYEKLLDKGAISRDEWDKIASQCKAAAGSTEAARARMELARKTLSDAIVRAPFAGRVDERHVSVGEYVQPNSKVAFIVELDPLRIQLSVGESDIQRIQEGQQVAFDVSAFPKERFRGTVKYIGPTVRADSRDLVVEAVVDNPDRKLRPGMFATAHLQLPEQLLPSVPRTTLVTQGQVTRLFAVVDGHIEERVVRTGPECDGLVAVLDGLQPGERVVNQPGPQVKDGTPVD
ncbi:efflux RND transporter periplasmic adaptor subunit [Myxococcus sp. K38C18041901]|uniref:efflux RND transporter periplasmic adaptor subunit n=1 Tax=Myxococcus guangdongensis TaxID=2906760 RepID=UPI0020A7E11C|nr:efflux RND transporter periplasmic adaptor subunit [Myxococcus guangdongensis]MCP3065588.1 efflux RND transporter periplasmic adaptor subunit [Myxococcus guangdongensis]